MTEPCCAPMRILREPMRQCDIELSEDDKLVSCDDEGDRLPPFNRCPWCGRYLTQQLSKE